MDDERTIPPGGEPAQEPPPPPEVADEGGEATEGGGWRYPDGRTLDAWGNEVTPPAQTQATEPEPEPEPAPAPTPTPPAQAPQAQAQYPAQQAQPQAPAEFTDQEREWLRASYASFDPDQMQAAAEFIGERKAQIAMARYQALQLATDPDPERALTRRYLQNAVAQNPALAQDPMTYQRARLGAAFDLGQRDGDPLARVERALAELRGTGNGNGTGQPPVAGTPPRDPATGQFQSKPAAAATPPAKPAVIPPEERAPRAGGQRRPLAAATRTPSGGTFATLKRQYPDMTDSELRSMISDLQERGAR